MRARVFARCAVCTHASVVAEGATAGEAEEPDVRARTLRPCQSCGGETRAAPAPHDLFSGWRCGCYQCTWTPC